MQSAWDGKQERRIGYNGLLYTKEDIERYYYPRKDIWDDLKVCAYQLSSYQHHLQSQNSASSQQHMPTSADDTHAWSRTADGYWHRTTIPSTIDAPQLDASMTAHVVALTTASTIDAPQLVAALCSPEQPTEPESECSCAAQSCLEQPTSAQSSQEQPRPAPKQSPVRQSLADGRDLRRRPVAQLIQIPPPPGPSPGGLWSPPGLQRFSEHSTLEQPTSAQSSQEQPRPAPKPSPVRHPLADGRDLRRRPVAQLIQIPPPPGPRLRFSEHSTWESLSDFCYASGSFVSAPQDDQGDTGDRSSRAAQSSTEQSCHLTTEANDAHAVACTTTLSPIDASQLDVPRDALGSPTASIPPPTIHLCPPPTIHRIKLTPRKRDPTSETNDAHVGAIDAPQLDASRSSDDHALAPMPSRPCPDAHALVLLDNDQALAPLPQVVLTGVQLEAMRRVSGRAGKYACSQQRDLRAQLLLTGEYEHDLTYGDWPWWDVIRSLPQDLRTLLVGPGVTMFTFKLVVGEMDHNYVGKPNDSGERHVFHIRRADNVAHHLHFHKNGSLDDPVKSQHTVTLPTTLPIGCVIRQDDFTIDDYNGALQPVGFDEGFITGPNIGRREAALACTILLDACGGQGRAASVDVTDEFAFPWRRWLLHQTNTYLYAVFRPQNIVRVFIYRGLFDFDEFHRLIRDDDDIPKIACCLADGTFVRYYPRSRTKKAEILDNWPAVRLFHRPHHVTLPWNRMHDRA